MATTGTALGKTMEELILLVSEDPKLYDKSSLWTKVLKKLRWSLYIGQGKVFS